MAAPTDHDLPAGLRYMVEHGHAADGSHALNTRPTQHLVNPRAVNPTQHASVAEWVRSRVQADEQMRSAKEAS
jgi:hypothetical protein